MNELDVVVQEFLIESHENLDQLDQDLVALEKDPRNSDRLASIFRTIHTIKGTAGFLEFTQLGALTHASENLLSRLRDGQMLLSPETTSALIVGGGGDRFAIPQVTLLELLYLEGERARRGIEYVHGAPVYRLRGNLLPLVDLNHELGVTASVLPPPQGGGRLV
jgi:chemotaxis protein histidine kinase CheA